MYLCQQQRSQPAAHASHTRHVQCGRDAVSGWQVGLLFLGSHVLYVICVVVVVIIVIVTLIVFAIVIVAAVAVRLLRPWLLSLSLLLMLLLPLLTCFITFFCMCLSICDCVYFKLALLLTALTPLMFEGFGVLHAC